MHRPLDESGTTGQDGASPCRKLSLFIIVWLEKELTILLVEQTPVQPEVIVDIC